jgi:hypothetical protein
VFEKRIGRVVAVSLSYEGEGRVEHVTLLFEGVEAFKCTYLSASDPSMLEAYDCVIDCGQTDWLVATRQRLSERGVNTDIRHLMIFFDDGPCYEMLCRSFHFDVREEANT